MNRILPHFDKNQGHCVIVSAIFEIGKATIVKVLQKGHTLDNLGNSEADIGDVIAEAA